MFRVSTSIAFALCSIAIPADPVVDAARVRQEHTKTLRIEYRQVSRVMLTATATRPPSELSTSADNRIVIDGDKVRVEDNNPGMSTGQGLMRQNRIELFDGTDSWTYFPQGMGADTTIFAIRRERSNKIDAAPPQPLFLYFRGLDPQYRPWTIDTLKSTERSKDIDGAKCLEYEHVLKDRITRYWFDPSKGHVAVLIESEFSGRVTQKTIISYRNDADHGWIPLTWLTVQFNPDGSPKYVFDSAVTLLELNQPIPAQEFQLTLPAGTYLHDQVAKKESRVQADGSTRELTAAEMYGSPRKITFRQWLARNAWTIVLIASLLLLLLLPILIRRRSRVVAAQAG